ncbi:alanine aminotransferase 2 isoform X1 [Cynoglossus semilaevis]|uniref:alanine aminotransferase 2 isoform X1 n=1 Tax=Cynoglossus semilaevis TaxID=244447 RepID=UPI00049697C0|nr:alanine aminotransferase 2-like isoform X1 [Cynoglossus semilaevis]
MSVLQNTPYGRSLKHLEYAALGGRAYQIRKELKQGLEKPFKTVIDVSSGNLHSAGIKPLTFVRQVFAACLYPQLIKSNKLPADVKQRAQALLEECAGGSVGSYTPTRGIPEVIHRISQFITWRDKGAASNPENIYLTPGSQWALENILKILVNRLASPGTGILTPVPCYSTSILSMNLLGAILVPYYLDEENGWELHVQELHRALASAKGVCNPRAVYIINPGNPVGQVQSKKSMQEVIQFVYEKRLILLADEVYQDSIYTGNSTFYSYRKVLSEMGPPFSDTVELASFHSVSKGFIGECGLRCGYVELVNLDPSLKDYIYKLFSKDSCAPVLGQIAMDLMTNPPQPGDPSYSLYEAEIRAIRDTVTDNVKRASAVFNSLPCVSHHPVNGGAFLFPKIDLPTKAVQKAKEENLEPDTFYCYRLLEETGVYACPGSEYGQAAGSHHIRVCTLISRDVMEELLTRLSSFHRRFMKNLS